jgi:hypothetical protein
MLLEATLGFSLWIGTENLSQRLWTSIVVNMTVGPGRFDVETNTHGLTIYISIAKYWDYCRL